MNEITLTNGAAAVLAQIANVPGLLTSPLDLVRVATFADTHLADLAMQPERSAHTSDASWLSALRAWDATKLAPIPVAPRVVESLRTMVRIAAEKGALPARPSTARLLLALDLAKDD